MNAKRVLVVALATLLVAASGAFAQVPPPPIVMTPHPNPISSLVLPARGEVPVSPVTPAHRPARWARQAAATERIKLSNRRPATGLARIGGGGAIRPPKPKAARPKMNCN